MTKLSNITLSDIGSGMATATDIRVLDGDTFEATLHIQLDLQLTTRVRIAGVDTPSLHGETLHERNKAQDAYQFLQGLLKQSIAETMSKRNVVRVVNPRNGKYAGRILADVYVDDVNVKDRIINEKYGVPYDGRTKPDWSQGGE